MKRLQRQMGRFASQASRALLFGLPLCAILVGSGWLSDARAQGACGNGNLNPGEQCDEGSGVNGTFESCCAIDCTFRTSGSACSLGIGDLCDAPNTCDGAGTCAVNVASSTKVCRAAADLCDAPEFCDGISTACGADQVATSGAPCRPAAGTCDVPESCDGANIECPADAVSPSTVVCRGAAGTCDVPESCDGSNVDCPADAKSTDVCRASTDLACDPAESCDGQGNDCPVDQYTTNGTGCDDGNECTIQDACSVGACVGNSQTCGDNVLQTVCGEECDDGGTRPGDGCSEVCTFETCRAAPRSDCIELTSAKFIAKEPKPTTANLRVILGRTEAPITVEDFGDFVNESDTFSLCVYDDADSLLRSYVVDRGGDFCQGRKCWAVNSKTGYSFKDLTADDSGIFKMRLRPGGAPGQPSASLQISGKTVKAPATSTLPRISADLEGNSQPTIQTTFDTGLCLSAKLDVGVLKRPGIYIGRKR